MGKLTDKERAAIILKEGKITSFFPSKNGNIYLVTAFGQHWRIIQNRRKTIIEQLKEEKL